MSAAPLRVLMYHRVVEPNDGIDGNPSVISATPSTFDRQMRHLAKHYRVVSAEEVLGAVRDGRSLPERAVLITFDDGYRDFGEVAWPILKRHRFSATLFVATAYPGHPEREFWWDRLARTLAMTERKQLERTPCGRLRLHTPAARAAGLRALRRALKTMPHDEAMRCVEELCRELGEKTRARGNVLTWNELRDLAADGVTVAAHTQTHPALTRLPLAQARAEIRGSREDLARELGRVTPVFSYPFGDHDDRVVEVVRQEGFELAVTCHDGHTRVPSVDPLRLRRTNVTLRTTPFIFRVRLTKYGSYVDGWRLAAKRRGDEQAALGVGS
jgi:peptidoglycan/xylan/chitin deacetylase (PgdA/CDA1 family)